MSVVGHPMGGVVVQKFAVLILEVVPKIRTGL